MEKHRPWRRVAAMFRRRRSETSLTSNSSRQPRLRGVHDSDTNNNHTPPPYILSRLFRDVYRSPQLPRSSPQPCTPLNHVVNWSALIFTSGQCGGNLETFRDFTPKCLSDINYEGLLHGQESYDNYSPSCWLEDHLHQFARVSDDIISEIENDNVGNEIVSSTDENFTFMSMPHRLQVNSSLPPGDTFRSDTSHGSNSSPSVHSSSGAGSRGSTISDVTQFYNNVNLTRITSAPNQPPPYSERSEEEPPPSYTDVFIPLTAGRRQSSTNARASNTLFQDILW